MNTENKPDAQEPIPKFTDALESAVKKLKAAPYSLDNPAINVTSVELTTCELLAVSAAFNDIEPETIRVWSGALE